MKKTRSVLAYFFILCLLNLIFSACRKEEIVIVYSKIETVGVTNTTSTATNVEGNITELTETNHSDYGFCWDTETNPTVYKNKLSLGSARTGAYTASITNLSPTTTYHVRAYVIDNKKYIYGSDKSFTTTAAILPTVTTSDITGITSIYGLSGGNVTLEGDKPVLAKGVCFDTIASPTIGDKTTIDGTGTGSFTSGLLNLIPSKKYYVRAYATSEFGVSYGSEKSFTTLDRKLSFLEDFLNNTHSWLTGPDGEATAELTNGEYRQSYSVPGYLWYNYIDVSGLKTMANAKDFEINVNMKVQAYGSSLTNSYGAFVWDCSATSFKYFYVQRPVSGLATSYSCTIGSFNGTYTDWKTTIFTGSDYNKLTIKKGGGYYYFFVNDVQVHKQAYSNITNEGIGFFVQDAIVTADYLYIEQKSDKKSVAIHSDYIEASGNNQRIAAAIR